ncbi:MAG: hypothetical protein ACHQT6_08350 [Candidatus Acidiferrales bacterium]
MSAYTPQFAPIVVLAFLGTGFLLAFSVLVLAAGLIRKSRAILRFGLLSGLALLLCYAGILLGLSLLSREVVLPVGAWKYFCEIDCHLAYSVEESRSIASVGPELQQLAGNGNFLVIQVKTWFDPATISAHRGDGPLTPNERKVRLRDELGRFYERSAREDKVLAALGLASTSLRTPLRPGEAYGSYFVFDVSADASELKLILTSADAEDLLLWGHENSPFHKKIFFSLSPKTRAAIPKSS